jgi:dUTP pyrophosphatase
MNEVKFSVYLANEKAKIPIKAHSNDSGYDVYSCEEIIIPAGQWRGVSTGLHFKTPEGWEICVRPRSGLALKNGITVLNSPGTIDEAYTGEVKIILHNESNSDFKVSIGDRIAQIVMGPVYKTKIIPINVKPEKVARGDGGFGSTGVK